MLRARLAMAAEAIMEWALYRRGSLGEKRRSHEEGLATESQRHRVRRERMRRAIGWMALGVGAILIGLVGGARLGPAQDGKAGIAKPLAEVKFDPDDDVKCLHGVVENGNPETGPSTFLMKASAGCVVKPHYHTAEEQLIVVKGDV